MNVDRALLTKAIQTGSISELMSRGVASYHFTNTPDGQECSEVLGWLSEHAKRYNVAPSPSLFRERFPNWAHEPSADPVEALIDAFFAAVKRRAFSAKVLELAHAEHDPSKWPELDVLMLDAAKDLAALVPSGRVSRFSDMPQRIDQYEYEAAHPEAKRGYDMGIKPFDEATNGMAPGNLITIAGFSGLGKSLLSTWALMNTYEQGAVGLMVSLEMTAEEIFERMDTMVVNFSHKLLGQRSLPDEQVELWRRISSQFSAARNDITVIDRAMGCTTDRVYAEINRYKPDVAVVDYVQLMRSRQNYASQWQSLVDITNDLKSIALATDTAIVMVSQDSRDSAGQGSTVTNMGGSISVYQAADIYIGMNQSEDMYREGKMEVRLLKNRRGGRQNSATLLWQPSKMQVEWQDPDAQASQNFIREAA